MGLYLLNGIQEAVAYLRAGDRGGKEKKGKEFHGVGGRGSFAGKGVALVNDGLERGIKQELRNGEAFLGVPPRPRSSGGANAKTKLRHIGFIAGDADEAFIEAGWEGANVHVFCLLVVLVAVVASINKRMHNS